MDRMLYIGMTGAKQIMQAQAVNANNLANVSTTGFKEDLVTFVSRPVEGAGYASRVNGVVKMQGVTMTPGSLVSTGRDLDVAISGPGWLVVLAPDGREKYTRVGTLDITPNGLLVTAGGLPVLGNGGAPIAIPPAEKVEIAQDGSISFRPLGQGPETITIIDRLKLVNPDVKELQKTGDGLFVLRSGENAEVDFSVRIQSGMIENSNVNAVSAMIDMIALARHFEMDVKIMKTAEELDNSSSKLLRLS